ncbi:MAG: hypothetical protein AAFN78_15965 [Pseudomonadota bacterium]
MANPFTYDIQQAGYGFDQVDAKGEATFEVFAAEFRKFPWKDQVGLKTGGSEPTISVKNTAASFDCWVSVLGTSEDLAYLVGIVYPERVRRFFGLGPEKEVRWLSANIVEDPRDVESLFQLHFASKFDELKSALGRYPRFLSQAARQPG